MVYVLRRTDEAKVDQYHQQQGVTLKCFSGTELPCICSIIAPLQDALDPQECTISKELHIIIIRLKALPNAHPFLQMHHRTGFRKEELNAVTRIGKRKRIAVPQKLE
ncbi:hypothetical protein VTK73DRAFT_2351 [Phialemonium thermophilum]|uniref:Uncharacterized protein n=1 Tax=Phialemonium thermophilum TaxID=223376 RepID=A0ABR3VS94_9PEZI